MTNTTLRVLATGNPTYGVATELNKKIANIEWISRSTGWDLTNIASLDRVVGKSMEYDVFINNSKLEHFNQILLAQRIACYWIKKEKPGHIVNLGSTADTSLSHRGPYPAEKVALKHYTQQIHNQWIQSKHNVRMSYIAVGDIATPTNPFFDDPEVNKLSPAEVADIIVFCIQQPRHFNLEEIRVEPRRSL